MVCITCIARSLAISETVPLDSRAPVCGQHRICACVSPQICCWSCRPRWLSATSSETVACHSCVISCGLPDDSCSFRLWTLARRPQGSWRGLTSAGDPASMGSWLSSPAPRTLTAPPGFGPARLLVDCDSCLPGACWPSLSPSPRWGCRSRHQRPPRLRPLPRCPRLSRPGCPRCLRWRSSRPSIRPSKPG